MDLPKSMAGRSPEDRDLPKIEKVTHAEGPSAKRVRSKKINLSIGGKGAINQRQEFFRDRVFLCTHLEVQWTPCPA